MEEIVDDYEQNCRRRRIREEKDLKDKMMDNYTFVRRDDSQQPSSQSQQDLSSLNQSVMVGGAIPAPLHRVQSVEHYRTQRSIPQPNQREISVDESSPKRTIQMRIYCDNQ